MAEVDYTGTELPCSKCKEMKSIEEFRKRPGRSEKGRRLGRWSSCNTCEKAAANAPHRRELSNAAANRFRKKLKRNESRRGSTSTTRV